MATKKKAITNPSLATWETLNGAVLQLSDPKALRALLATEQKGRNRARFVARIQSRLNRVSTAGMGNAGKKVVSLLVLGFMLLVGSLNAQQLVDELAPWKAGQAVSLKAGHSGEWLNNFTLVGLVKPWAVFACNCDTRDMRSIRVAVKMNGLYYKILQGEPLVGAGPLADDSQGGQYNSMQRMRFLNRRKIPGDDGFDYDVLYFEPLANN